MNTETKSLFFSISSYCVCTLQGFTTKYFLIFIIDEVKNFAANNIFFKLVSQSRTGIHAKGWRSYIEEFRGSKAVKSFYCKFIYGDYRVQKQRFCTRSEISLYYSGLLFGKASPQVLYCETSLFHWFSWIIISCLIYFFVVHDIDFCLF